MTKNFHLIVFSTLIILSTIFFNNFETIKKEKKVSGAYKALNIWSTSRSYPNSNIPQKASYTAKEFSKKNLNKKISKASNVDPWKAIGPHNQGGRTLAIAFNPKNPNTIYAGSASGGLWRSYTGGVGAKAWHYVKTGFPILGVSSIAIAPNDSNTIYIGTGEVYNKAEGVGSGSAYRLTRGSYGMGILKTTDGGGTWVKSLDWSYQQQRGIQVVRINPKNKNTVYAGTTEGTYKTVDGGKNWVQIHNVIMTNDLIINPQDTSIIITTNGNFQSNGHGLYRSTDAGSTWKKISTIPQSFNGKAQLSVSKSSPNIYVVSIGEGWGERGNNDGIGNSYISNSYGEYWTTLIAPNWARYQGWFSHDIAINPSNSEEIIAIGINIWKSSDGGNNFNEISQGGGFPGEIPPGEPEGSSRYSHVDHHDVVYHPTNHSIIYFANDGGIFRTTNGGSTFAGCNGGYQTTQFYNGVSVSQNNKNLIVGGLQDNSTALFRGTTTWQKFAIGGDGSWTGIDYNNDNIIYGSYQNLAIAKSMDNGKTFFFGGSNFIPVPNSNRTTAFIAPYVVGIFDSEVLYAGRDIVYKSLDAGKSWVTTNNGNPLDGNPVLTMAIAPQTNDIVYAATAPSEFIKEYSPPGVFRTINGGISWSKIDAQLPDRFPGDLLVDPNNRTTVYITFLGFGSSHIYKSIDQGANWKDIDNGKLPDVPTWAVAVDPNDSRNIYVGNDIGVYYSSNGGIDWEEYQTGLPDAVIVSDIKINKKERLLRLATHGNGFYERSLVNGSTDTVENELPTNFKLHQNYPNPFNPSTTINYELSKAGNVKITIFDITGSEIKTLINKFQQPGKYSINFDSEKLTSGTYIYRLSSNKSTISKKDDFTKINPF